MTTAIAGIVSSLLGGFGSKGAAPAGRQREDTSTPALALAKDLQLARLALKNAREERAYAVLTDPLVLGTLVTIGGVLVAANLPFHSDPKVNLGLQGVAASSAVLMGLGRAGCGDMTTLAMAAGTAGILALSGIDSSDKPDAPGWFNWLYGLGPYLPV